MKDAQALQHAIAAQALFVELHDAIAPLENLDDVLWEVVTRIGRHLRVSRCLYGEIDATQQHVSVRRDFTDGVVSVVGTHRMDDFGPPLIHELKAGHTLVASDIETDPRTAQPQARRAFEAIETRALLCVPLIKAGRFVSMLVLHHHQPRDWLAHEIQLIEQLAQRAWSAVEAVRAKASLRESRDVLRLAMRGGRMGAWSRDLMTNDVWWSRELEEVFGLEPGAFEGTRDSFRDLVHPEDRDRLAAAVEQAVRQHTDYQVDFRFHHAGGAWRWMEGRGWATYMPDGRPATLYGFGMDITERREAQALLVRQAAIFEHQTDAIVVMDLEGYIVDLNPAGLRMLGYTTAEVIGQPISMFHRPDETERIRREAARALADHGHWRGDVTFVRKDGSQGLCESVVRVLADANGTAYGSVGVNRDITERTRVNDELRRLNAELSEADRRKDEFLATLAHELRNPLAPMRNALEIMRLRAGTDPQSAWPREVLDRQLTHLTRLVDDLMEVSRITRGRLELRRQPLELGAALQAAVEAVRPTTQAAYHELAVRLPTTPLWVNADAGRLAQVLHNLLHNAAKYTRNGGRIALSAERDGTDAVIRVCDNGIGIAPEHLERIFDMFSQVTPALERSQGGLGIGLALVRGLVELHGGSVQAHSAGAEQGSEFVVRLPVCADAPAPKQTHAPMAPVGHRHQRVLVVDDNRDALESLATLLELQGHEVLTAGDGLSAVQVAASFHPDVVLLDIGLPGLNGYEAARQMRKQPSGAAIKLVALTGWGQAQDKARATQAGFDHHLTKPVSPDDLRGVFMSAGVASSATRPAGPSAPAGS